MDTHKGQTKYSITLNNDTSDIVKITRAEPGSVPGRWGSEKEVKLDSIGEDIYGTSKHEVEKMYDEAVNPKIDDAEQEEENNARTPVVEDEEENNARTPVVEEEEENNARTPVVEEEEENNARTPVVEEVVKENEEEERKRKEKAALNRELTSAIAKRKEQIGQGRKTRKDKKRTTRKKIRKGAHGKSNKKGRKNTRGKR